MDLVKIDGKVYDALVTAISEKADIKEGKNKGTSLHREREIRDIAGIKYEHSITFAPSDDAPELFDELFSYLFDSIRESVQLEVVHGQQTISYEAAYSTGQRSVGYIRKDKDDEGNDTEFVGWNELTVAFRSIEAVITE